jgi:hypothetical protein
VNTPSNPVARKHGSRSLRGDFKKGLVKAALTMRILYALQHKALRAARYADVAAPVADFHSRLGKAAGSFNDHTIAAHSTVSAAARR